MNRFTKLWLSLILLLLGSIGAKAATVTITGLAPGTTLCAGATGTLSYTVTAPGSYGGNETFTAQLSDASGSFASPTAIGTHVDNNDGDISITIPNITTGGAGYKIRIVNTASDISNELSVTLNVTPTVTITPTPAGNRCVGSTITYTTEAGQSAYNWNISGTLNTDYTLVSGGTNTSNTAEITWLTPGAKTVSVNYSNGTCTAPTATVQNTTIGAVPVASFIAPPAGTVCTNTPVVYTTQSGSGFSNYSWNISGGTAGADYDVNSGGDASSNATSITWKTAGSYTVTVNYLDGNNCTSAAPASTTTTVSGRPAVSFTVQPGAEVCEETPITYETQSGGGISAFDWDFPGSNPADYTINSGGTALSNSVVVTWHTPGTRTVTVNYLNVGLCPSLTDASNTTSVKANVGTPAFGLGASSTRCQGAENLTYTATATESTSISYALDATSLAAGNTINTTTGEVTYVSGWSGSSTITATAAGCGASTNAPHTVTTTPTVGTPVFSLGATTIRCQGGGNVTYTATASDATSITYSLDAASLAGGNTINSSNGQVSYNANWNGTTIITASANGCNGPSTTTHTVTIVGLPVFSLGTSSNRCQGFATINYSASAVNGTGMTYALNGSGTGTSVINTSTGVVTWDPAFAGSATITATTSGCISPLSTIHTVNVAAGVGATSFSLAPLTPCQGSTVDYDAVAANNTGIVYAIATTPSGNATMNPATGVVTFNPSFVGTAIVTATASGCGPSTFATQNIVIQPVVTQPVFNVGPSNNLCQAPGNITYTATASNTIGPMVYSLTPAGAGTINAATGQVSYNPGFTGTATIKATATGCNGTAENTFVVNITPTVGVPVFALGTSSVRKQGAGSVTYGATASNTTGITYSLAPATAGNIVANTGQVTYNASFSGTATITATAFGCNITPQATHTVTVVQTPVFTAGGASTRCQQGTNVPYTANSSNGTVSYSLITAPVDANTTINTATGVVSFSSDFSGTATISAVSTNGTVVTDAATHVVTVNPAPRLSSTVLNHVLCSGASTAIQLVASTGSGSTFVYNTLGGGNISGKSAGTTSVISQLLTNTSNSSPDSFFYEVIVTSPAPASCPSVVKDSIKVRVNPKPAVSPITAVTICSESSVSIPLSASAPSTFAWTVTAPTKINNAQPGVGDTIRQTLINSDVSVSPTAGIVTYSITPTSLFGCAGNPATAQVTVNPLPVVSFTPGASRTICSDEPVGVSLSANISSTFAWQPVAITSLNQITGQSAGSGSIINYVLNNSSNLIADSIGFRVTPTTIGGSPSCVGHERTVVVKVYPKPSMTTTKTSVICSKLVTNIPLSASIPSTFNWTIGTVNGNITGQSGSSAGATSIQQTLDNPSFVVPGTVDYIVTPSSNTIPSCIGKPDTITVTVNPQPKLTSDSTRVLCSDEVLLYQPTSSVAAGTTTFRYDRVSTVPSIINQDDVTTTNIRDTLSSAFILTPAIVDYEFVLRSAAGCELADQHLRVTVNPTPDTPGLAIFPQTKLCSGATSMNFSTSRIPDAREYYKWTTVNGGTLIQKADSSFSQNALISFPQAGNASVSIVSNVRGFNCPSKPTTRNFQVGSAGGNQNINVVFFSNNLVAQVAGAKSYQWGFDRKLDLDSTIIAGETTQSYDTRKGFNTAANLYWVMVTFGDDCVQKAYFNAPTLNVAQQSKHDAVELKMYPNPAQDVLSVELSGTSARDLVYEVYDLAGKRMSQTVGSAKARIPVDQLAAGYYVLTCSEAGVRVATSRFIKQ